MVRHRRRRSVEPRTDRGFTLVEILVALAVLAVALAAGMRGIAQSADGATLLKQRTFVQFWLTRLAGTAANQMLMVAVGWQMYELTGSAWEGKVVGFLNAAGGDTSYMSVMSMASSLMLDFRCVIVPRFVYATGSAFRDGVVSDRKVAGRIDELAQELVRFAKSLAKP